MTTRPPNPMHHTDFDRFCAAYVEWATAQLPRATNYDEYHAAKAINQTLGDATNAATETAWEIYDHAMEAAADAYERGVGPAWAD